VNRDQIIVMIESYFFTRDYLQDEFYVLSLFCCCLIYSIIAMFSFQTNKRT